MALGQKASGTDFVNHNNILEEIHEARAKKQAEALKKAGG